MKKNIEGLILILFTLLLTSCFSSVKGDKRIVTVTIEPLRYFTEQIAGDKFSVKTMVPRGNNPETYEPTARQMVDLSQSDLYIKVGNIGFERTWMKKIEDNSPHTIIINSSEGITSASTPDGATDPHTWMSAANARVIATNIFRALTSIDQKDSVYFRANLRRLCSKIDCTDEQVRGILGEVQQRAFLIYHPALTYYARDYALTQIAIEAEGREPSARQLQDRISKGRSMSARVLFVQKEFSNRDIDIIVRETGARKEEINPLSYDWNEEMIRVAKCLSRSPSI